MKINTKNKIRINLTNWKLRRKNKFIYLLFGNKKNHSRKIPEKRIKKKEKKKKKVLNKCHVSLWNGNNLSDAHKHGRKGSRRRTQKNIPLFGQFAVWKAAEWVVRDRVQALIFRLQRVDVWNGFGFRNENEEKLYSEEHWNILVLKVAFPKDDKSVLEQTEFQNFCKCAFRKWRSTSDVIPMNQTVRPIARNNSKHTQKVSPFQRSTSFLHHKSPQFSALHVAF